MKITLCGSARFENLFHLWNEVLTLSGHTVYSLAVYPSQKQGIKQWYTDEEKVILDKAHFQKIKASDAILVLNKFAYIGPSTLNEIKYADKLDRKVYCLESWGKGLGIGHNHNESYQEAAEKYGVFWTPSPIDTFNYKDVWDLLPEAGAYRSKLVAKVYESNAVDFGIKED